MKKIILENKFSASCENKPLSFLGMLQERLPDTLVSQLNPKMFLIEIPENTRSVVLDFEDEKFVTIRLKVSSYVPSLTREKSVSSVEEFNEILKRIPSFIQNGIQSSPYFQSWGRGNLFSH